MRRWVAGLGEPPSRSNPSTTENPSKDSCRRGKWLLRSTKIRQARENNEAIVKPPVSKPLKRKRSTPSPTPSAHSFTSENSVQLPTMDRRNNDVGMWSYATTEKLIEILLQEAKKEQSANTRKTRVFNAHQWKNAHKEFQRETTRAGYTLKQLKEKYNRIKAEYRLWQDLMRHTGKGWDEELQTVAFPDEVWKDLLQKNTDYGKFRDKPIDHRNMLEELLEGALANGAFANPSVNGGSSSEGDRQKYGPPKTVRRGDVMSTGGKRKSDGSGGSAMKKTQVEHTFEAYDRVAIANERKAEFYETLIANTGGASSSSIDKCIAALGLVKPFVDERRYWKAYGLFCGGGGGDWRQGFMGLPPDERIEWVRNLNIND